MMTLFRNYRPPPASSTPDKLKAGHCSIHLETRQPQYPVGTPGGQICQYPDFSKGQPRVSAYSQAEGQPAPHHR